MKLKQAVGSLILLFLALGALAQPSNDNQAAATDVTGLINSCSAGAAYTTIGATGDQSRGTCAANGPNYNVWFKFTASATTFIDVQVNTGAAAGTNQYTFLTLWDASLTQLACAPYVSQQYGTNEASFLGLTPGSTYYISVDNYVGAGYRGTFQLCLSDVVTYNYEQGAQDVTSLINSCSANAAYTTVGATPDQSRGSCSPNGPNNNVWFKFTATASTFIDVQAITGGAAGTNQYTFLTLWDNLLNQLACTPYVSQQYGTNELTYLGLTPGQTYYISVDNYTGNQYRGSFKLCLSDVVTYDYKSGAQDITGLINTCSANAAYSTVGATADQSKGTCAANGPNYNVWFKFTASATGFIDVQVNTGGAVGSNQYTFLTLWDASLTQLACSPYVSQQYGTNETSYLGLTPGATYYISVDNYVGAGYRGTFQLCLSDVVTYDYKSGAQDVTSLINSCSANAAYTTVGATADQSKGTCAANGPNYNVWFKFTASATGFIDVQVNTGASAGTNQYTFLTLWDASLTQLSCSPYVSQQYGTNEATYLGLTPGATYYISVDNYVGSGYRGSFQLCLSDVITYDYQSGAKDVTSLINTCSANAAYTTIGASGDQAKGTCAANGPNYNVWFKFTASATGFIDAQVITGGAAGTNQYTFVTLWDASLTQLNCSPYVSQQYGTNEATYLGLTPGATYYISVDNYVGSGYRGSFQLCLSDVITYDYQSGAKDVTSLINTCSANAAYTTIGASGDQAKGTCAANGPNYNVWFKFTASATGFIDAQVITGGAAGTNQYTFVTLWDASLTQLNCSPYVSQQYGTNEVSYLGLTPGATYYISVDNYVGAGYRGTFQLCLSDVVTYDWKSGAKDVTSLINTCSSNAAYTTIGASSDQSRGTCAANGPNYNVWFKFTASATGFIDAQVITGGAAGTNQYTFVTLWDASLTQINCSPYLSQQYGTNEVSYLGLTPGATYYISVDNYVGAGYRGTFQLCLSDVVTYDWKSGAKDVTSLINTCSANAAYTTIGASSDQSRGTCAANGPNYNVWFKFTASATGFIDAQVITGGAAGTNQYTFVTLWDASLTQLNCSPYVSQQYGTNEVTYLGLTPGATYYISVDNFVGAGYRGTFKLCLSDVVTYDFYQGAINLTNLNSWCSANAAYTTVGATKDKNNGSCWNTTGGSNRWFKFTAITANATIQLHTGAAAGTMQYPYLALWQADGTTQIACATYSSQYSTLSFSVASLVPGSTYYISVDNHNGSPSYRGSFQLCVNNIGTTYYSRANAAWNVATTWSTVGYGGAAAASYPNAGDVANIQNNTITVSSNQQAAEINLSVTTASTSLTVSNSSLTVNGKMTMVNAGANFPEALVIQNSSSLYVNDVFNVTRGGGNQTFGVTVSTGCSLTVNVDMNWSSSGGSVNNSQLTVNGTGSVIVNEDVLLNSTGGPLIKLQFNNNAVLTVVRDVSYTATAAGLDAIELNNSAQLNIARNFVRGATPYGALTCNNTSTVAFNSTNYAQTMAGDAGSGGDSFFYNNVIFNNTFLPTPQITVGGSATVNGNLTMTSGIVSTTATNILNLKNATATTIGNSSCYIDGPMTYEVATNTANTVRNLPIGNNGSYRPAVLTVTHSDNTSVIYTAQHFSSSAASLGYTLAPTIDKVSGARYWSVNRQAVANLTTANIRLYYGIGTSDGVTDYTHLTVVKNVGAGTTWVDVGGTATANGTGNILSGNFNSFCNITLADLNGGVNTLPVTLVSFTGTYENGDVTLKWITASEVNNDHFTIEKSSDGVLFREMTRIPGAGTSTQQNSYTTTDEAPYPGMTYYRLTQTDYNGVVSTPRTIAVISGEVAGQQVVVFPNPSEADGATLQLNGFNAATEVLITVRNLLGETISTFTLTTDGDGAASDLIRVSGALNTGMYLVTVSQSDGKHHTVRWVIR